MPARWIARLITLLVFVTQGLSPFLHAHAGTALPSAGAPLHLHLADVIANGGDRRWSQDEGRVVQAPPEVRRDVALAVAECPDAPLPVQPVVLNEAATHEEAPAPYFSRHGASAPSAHHARGPPPGRLLASC